MPLIVIDMAEVDEYHGSGVPVEFRLYANRDFTADDGGFGVFIAKGSDSNQGFYQTFGASLVSNRIRLASGNAWSTTDALNDDGLTTYTGVVYDADGRKLKTVFSNLRIPSDLSPITWGQLVAYSSGRRQKYPSTYLSSSAILAILAGYITSVVRATTVALGIVRIDTVAVDPLDPEVVGSNSPKLVNPATDTVIGHVTTDTGSSEVVATDSPLLSPGAITTSKKYRHSYATLALAKTAAAGGELCFDVEETISANTTLEAAFQSSFEGTGILGVNSGVTLTHENLRDPGDRKTYKGLGTQIIKNASRVRASSWTGPFGGTTTLNGAINSAVTSITLANALIHGPAPFVISIDQEQILVTTAPVANVCTVQRGYGGTTAASHSNGATVHPSITNTMRDGMIMSLSVMGGGILDIGPGSWTTRGGWDLPNGSTLQGSGGIPDAIGGTNLRLLDNNTYIVKTGEMKRFTNVQDITLDATGRTGATCYELSGTGSTGSFNPGLSNVSCQGGDYGVRLRDTASTGWLAIGLIINRLYCLNQTIACFQSFNTPNTSVHFGEGCSFTPYPNGTSIGIDLNYSGPITGQIPLFNGVNINPRYYHSGISAIDTTGGATHDLITTAVPHNIPVGGTLEPVTIRTNQAHTGTVVAPAGITTSGNARAIVTAAGMTNSPKTVTVPVTTGAHTTAALIAAAFRTALAADPDVSAFFTIGGTGANFIGIKLTDDGANDSTMNFTIEDVTSVGITDDLTSTDTSIANLPGGYTDKQVIYWRSVSTTTGYAYKSPKGIFSFGSLTAEEPALRYDFSTLGANNVLRTTVPIMVGVPRAAMRVQNTHCGISFEGWQDEGFPISIEALNTFEKTRAIHIHGGSTLQGLVLLYSPVLLKLDATNILAGAIKDYSDPSSTISADVEVNACGLYNPTGGQILDAGSTAVDAPGRIASFVGNSVLYADIRGGGVQFNAPVRVVMNHPHASDARPTHTTVRDRSVFEFPLNRTGLKEPGVENVDPTIYYDDIILDDTTFPAPTYPWMKRWLDIRPLVTLPANEQGVYVRHFAARGVERNMLITPLVSVAGVTTLNAALSKAYFFDTDVGEHTTINLSVVAGQGAVAYEEKIVYIPATTTNRNITWGTGFRKYGSGTFQTGNLPGLWVFRFGCLSDGTLEQQGSGVLLTAGGAAADGFGPEVPFRWRGTSGTAQQMAVNQGYIVTAGTLFTATLPLKSQVADTVAIQGYNNAGGWKIAQNAGQSIYLDGGGVVGTDYTTAGVTGDLSSTGSHDTVFLLCVADDTVWQVVGPHAHLNPT